MAKSYSEQQTLINAGNKMGMSNTIMRDKGIPLDSSSIQTSSTKATYAASNNAYIGQIITVVPESSTDTTTIQPYVIKDTAGNLKRIVCDGDIIEVRCGGTGATTKEEALQNLGLTATATELNYCVGVTSDIQGQLDGKAQKSHAYSSDDYGVGTNTEYGHVKILEGVVEAHDLSDASGLAAALKHSHSKLPNSLTLIDEAGHYYQMKASSFTAMSDKRLKENIVPYTPTKNTILELPIYKFDFINNGSKNNIGCLAQDLQKICPEIIHEGEDGYLSIEESKIVYLLLEEVKQLRRELDELKERYNYSSPNSEGDQKKGVVEGLLN